MHEGSAEVAEGFDWPHVEAWFGPMTAGEVADLGQAFYGQWELADLGGEQVLMRQGEDPEQGLETEPEAGFFLYGGHTFQNLMMETEMRSGPEAEPGWGGLALVHGEDPASAEILAITLDWRIGRVAVVRYQGSEKIELDGADCELPKDRWLRLHLRNVGNFQTVWLDSEPVLTLGKSASGQTGGERRLGLVSGSTEKVGFRNLRATELVSRD